MRLIRDIARQPHVQCCICTYALLRFAVSQTLAIPLYLLVETRT